MKLLPFIIFIAMSLSACNNAGKTATTDVDTTKTETKSVQPVKKAQPLTTNQGEVDKAKILAWAKSKNLDMQSTPEGIYYIIEKAGSGENPTASSRVTTHYEGTLLNGTKFDSSYDRGEPISFGLGQVIKGWQIAIPMLKKGGKGKFVIPSSLAYGSRDSGPIPANSVLVFDVELVDF